MSLHWPGSQHSTERIVLADFRILVPLALLLGLAALAAVVIVPAVAQANHVQCGDVITTSVKLDSDVICPQDADDEGAALVIGADNVRLNGAGFKLVNATTDPEDIGIVTDAPHRNVAIRNLGGMSNFHIAMSLDLDDSRFTDNRFDSSSTGVSVRGDGNVFRRNVFSAEAFSLRAVGDDLRVTDNTASSQFGEAIVLEGSRLAVRRNDGSEQGGAGASRVIVVDDHAGEGVVIDNRAYVSSASPEAIFVVGGKKVRRNEIICYGQPSVCSEDR